MIKKYLEKIDSDLVDLLKGGAAAFTLRILGIAFLYTLTLYITNYFGAAIYGDYAFFVSVVKIASVFAIFGVDSVVLRYVADYLSRGEWSGVKNLTIDVYKVVGLSAIVFSLILIALSQAIGQFFGVSALHIVYIGLAILPYSIFKLNNQYFRANRQIVWFAIFEYILVPFFTIAILFSVSFFEIFTTDQVIISYLIGIALIAFGTTTAWYGKVKKKRKSGQFTSLYGTGFFGILKKGYPFLLASSSLFLGPLIVQMIIKYFNGSAELGIYDAVLKVAQLAMLPLVAINVFIAPKLSAYHSNQNADKLKQISQRSTSIVLLLTVPTIIVIFIFAETIAGFFGPEFVQGATALRILALGQFINAITGPVGIILQMTENQKIFKNIIMFTMVSSLALSFLMIPLLGLVGAAIGNMLFQSVASLICLFYVNKKLKFNTFKLW